MPMPGQTTRAPSGTDTEGAELAGALAAAARDGGDAKTPCRSAHRAKLTTGRRLFLAFSAVVGTFLIGLVPASAGLRKIEKALEQMRGCEERVQLALELEGA